MKQKFSLKWKASKQPRKQRKYLWNAPFHIKRKFLSAHLDKELRKKYSRRNIEIRKGDEAKIMRGKFKGKQGKVDTVDAKKSRVSIEGIQGARKDGTKVNAWFHASKLKIIELNLDDRKRIKKLAKSKQEEKEKKPADSAGSLKKEKTTEKEKIKEEKKQEEKEIKKINNKEEKNAH